MKGSAERPFPLEEVLEVLQRRAVFKEGKHPSWEKVAEETHHSKPRVLSMWKWFKGLSWEEAKSLVGSLEEVLRLRPDYLQKTVQDLAKQKEAADPVKAKSWADHHGWLKEVATSLLDRMQTLIGASKPHEFLSEVKDGDAGPVWRPALEGLEYLKAHLESTPQLFQIMNEIEGLAGQYVRGGEGLVEGLSQQLRGCDDMVLEESQWRRGLRPSFFAKLNEAALATAGKMLIGARPPVYVIGTEDRGGWMHLIIGGTTVALSESETELEEWGRLFWSLVPYAAEILLPLLRLKQKFQERVRAFSSLMDPIIKAGFFEGTCPVCHLLR